MGGGLMQLVAYGAQDIYLTGNPQITFFKVVYRRHTNFSMEAIQQTMSGSIGSTSSTVTTTISRNGDLVTNLWLDVKMSSQTEPGGDGTYQNWMNNTGHAFIKDCEIEIGGQKIDKHYGHWLDVWHELTDHEQKENMGLNKHAAKKAYLKCAGMRGATQFLQLYIPLKFWFCRNPGLALPLIALQYHEVKIKLSTRGMAGLINGDYAGTTSDAAAPSSVKLWADYIYLDTDERRRFAQVSHEYLIEQLQKVEATASASLKLNFNHPVKELIWVIQDSTVLQEETDIDEEQDVLSNVEGASMVKKNDYFNYAANNSNNTEYINNFTSHEPFGTLKLQLNGHDRFAARNASYFRTCQPIQAGHRIPSKHVYCYSFALKPEEHQPSGTCNFSRIDTARFVFGGTAPSNTSTVTVYAVNYNVLRIMSGMGGLAYSN